ncbi:response regulator transcription factor [Eremococcus coleocola]|uniref:response regulator transcription factor n=1 Tax=Eremococcus coleocola TaxID=88132 RepID=UPI00040CF9CC|nr:response regulator transcription factor [Eremococcus coleocola]
MKVLIIEDDVVIAQALADYLAKWQLEAVILKDFRQVLEEVQSQQPHLILLDINLPYFNGYHWCSEIRKFSQVPIIFISSMNDKMDMIMAMQLGGDDFISKPLDMTLTLSKIQALLRRSYEFTEPQVAALNRLTYEDLVLDRLQAKLLYQGHDIDLTHTELQILQVLFQAQPAFASRQAILDACWQNDQFIDDNTLAVNMTRIRKKLRPYALDTWLQTKKNHGYALRKEA